MKLCKVLMGFILVAKNMLKLRLCALDLMLKRSSKERSGLRMTNSFFSMLMWIAATAA